MMRFSSHWANWGTRVSFPIKKRATWVTRGRCCGKSYGRPEGKKRVHFFLFYHKAPSFNIFSHTVMMDAPRTTTHNNCFVYRAYNTVSLCYMNFSFQRNLVHYASSILFSPPLHSWPKTYFFFLLSASECIWRCNFRVISAIHSSRVYHLLSLSMLWWAKSIVSRIPIKVYLHDEGKWWPRKGSKLLGIGFSIFGAKPSQV